jgi:shikimate dehydrogenase
VCFALLRTDVGSLVIANRTAERAEALAKAIQEHVSEVGKMTDVSFLPWGSSQLCKAVQNSQLIINCTTMGMRHSLYESQSPLARDWIPQHALIYDLVYNPPETPLLREASKAGASALNGLPMLVYQGAASFELWTTREAPLDIIFDAVRMALS